jgi:hypothetical protein
MATNSSLLFDLCCSATAFLFVDALFALFASVALDAFGSASAKGRFPRGILNASTGNAMPATVANYRDCMLRRKVRGVCFECCDVWVWIWIFIVDFWLWRRDTHDVRFQGLEFSDCSPYFTVQGFKKQDSKFG